jgi:hypothetical protein
MKPTDLRREVEKYFNNENPLGLKTGHVQVERVLNWGGFVTSSFQVSDGERRIHVKLAAEQPEMRRWMAVHEYLEQHYRAPRVLAWVDLPGTTYGGLAFEWIIGRPWDVREQPELLGAAVSRIVRRRFEGRAQ